MVCCTATCLTATSSVSSASTAALLASEPASAQLDGASVYGCGAGDGAGTRGNAIGSGEACPSSFRTDVTTMAARASARSPVSCAIRASLAASSSACCSDWASSLRSQPPAASSAAPASACWPASSFRTSPLSQLFSFSVSQSTCCRASASSLCSASRPSRSSTCCRSVSTSARACARLSASSGGRGLV